MPGPRGRGGRSSSRGGRSSSRGGRSSSRGGRSSSRGGQRQTRSSRAELLFSVSQVERVLREGRYSPRLGSTAPVYLAAVIEYLTAKILALAGNEAQSSGRSSITPELLDMVIYNNSLLSGFLGDTTISQVAPPHRRCPP